MAQCAQHGTAQLLSRTPALHLYAAANWGIGGLKLQRVRHDDCATSPPLPLNLQAIGAYTCTVPYEGEDKQVTFLDTPGHEVRVSLCAVVCCLGRNDSMLCARLLLGLVGGPESWSPEPGVACHSTQQLNAYCAHPCDARRHSAPCARVAPR